MAGRKVKCQDTGEYGNSLECFKGEDGKYYTNEDAALKVAVQKARRKSCISLIYNCLNYESWMKLPSVFWKFLSDNEPYGYDVVYRCMLNKYKDVEWALVNKNFSSETAKMMYIIAIFNNGMNDALKQTVAEKRAKLVTKQTEDVEDIDVPVTTYQRKVKNISNFLEDDDD